MSVASRRNQKNLYAKPDIIGRDILQLGASDLQAAAGNTALADGFGGNRWVVGSDARLEGFMIQVGSGDLTLGRIGVEVQSDGLVVASGSLYAGGPAGGKYVALLKDELLDVPLASGAVLTANYAVEQPLDTQQDLRVSVNLTLLEGSER